MALTDGTLSAADVAAVMNGNGNNRNNPAIQEYSFKIKDKFRYVRFQIEATKTLPSWHASYTNKSWIFLDEIIVK